MTERTRLYVETTVVSYLVARPSRDVIVAGHQQTTHDWWQRRSRDSELCISQLVIEEAASGDRQAVENRLAILEKMTVLEIADQAVELAEVLVRGQALPAKAGNDALHIAVAAVHRVPFLVTWNCRHLANAVLRKRIEALCAEQGFAAPVICTPEELLEVDG